MNMHKLRLYGFVVLFVLLGAATWLVISKSFPIRSAEAASQPVVAANPSEQDQALTPAAQENTTPAVQASNFRMEQGYFMADVCFERPSRADWLLSGKTSLEIGEETIQVFEIGLLDPSTDIDSAQRCDYMRFPVGETEITDFRIVVPRLETSFPDSLDCPSAQQKLDAAGTGIVIRCVEGAGFYGPELVSKPDTLSEEDAHRMIYEAFIETLTGPWIFEGTLE